MNCFPNFGLKSLSFATESILHLVSRDLNLNFFPLFAPKPLSSGTETIIHLVSRELNFKNGLLFNLDFTLAENLNLSEF